MPPRPRRLPSTVPNAPFARRAGTRSWSRARRCATMSTYHCASAALRRAVEARLDEAAPESLARGGTRGWWREAVSFGVGAALAAMLVLVVRPMGDDSLVAAVVDDHVRSLQPGHLADVISTDQHTVKPWFDGKLDFAPPVKDSRGRGLPAHRRPARLSWRPRRRGALLPARQASDQPADLARTRRAGRACERRAQRLSRHPLECGRHVALGRLRPRARSARGIRPRLEARAIEAEPIGSTPVTLPRSGFFPVAPRRSRRSSMASPRSRDRPPRAT